MKAKKWFAALLAAVMLIAAFGPAQAFADAYVDMNEGGWAFRYYFNGCIELTTYIGSAKNVTVPDKIGVHPVSGFHEYPEKEKKHIISGHNVESITFELRVGEIPRYFADNCPNLKRVTLPDTVETISKQAFKGCAKLTGITLPDGIKTIEEQAFSNCDALAQVNLPESLRTIGDYAFVHCRALTSVTLPASLRTLGKGAFSECYKLEQLTIKEGLQRIGDEAFANCNCLSEAKLPDSVVNLGKGIFKTDYNMIKAKLPSGLQGIPAETFYGCSALEKIDIPASVRLIRASAFEKCSSLETVTLPAGLTTLEDYAFAETPIESIYIPGGVSNIGAHAFSKCRELVNVEMGYGVLTIGESIYENTDDTNYDGYAFSECSTNLKVTLPASVLKVYHNAFPALSSVTKYFDGEKRLFDRVEFESEADKANFRFRVPIKFATEHGEAPAAVTPYSYDKIRLPMAPEAQGYYFDAWERSSDGNHFDDYVMYTVGPDAVTFTAKWTARENTVDFVTEKGDTPPRQTVYSGNRAAMPAGQTAGDEYLAGWYRTPDFSGEPYDFSEPVLTSFTLYAKWTSAPLIIVNLTGVAEGSEVLFRDKNDDSLLYARFTWSGQVRVPADAVMEINTGSGMEYSGSIVSEIPLDGDLVEVRTVNIVNGTPRYTPDYGSRTTVNVTFTAAPQIVANAVGDDGLDTDGLWTLTDGYDPPHILTGGSPVTVSETEGIADPRNDLTLTLIVPEGYGCDGTIFNGGEVIAVSEGKTVYYMTPKGVVTLNLHYYKKADYVTLTFNSGRDSQFFTQKYPKGESAPESFTVPDCPYTYSTAAFNRWQSEAGDFAVGANVSLPQSDTAYTAVWDAAYGLTLRANGGSGETEKRMILEKDGYTVTLPECPFYNSGYAFIGWNTKANGTGTGYQPGDSLTLTKATSLYAQWQEAYRVRLYANYEGSVVSYIVQWIPQGGNAPLATLMEREGFLLTGYNTVRDGSGTSYAPGEPFTPTRDTALYAQWHEHDYRFDSFVWAADNATAQAKLVCAGDETHVVYADAEMAACEHGASCDDDAYTVYEALYGDVSETRTVTEEGSALGHDYGEPEWTWTIQSVETDEGEVRIVEAMMEMFCPRCGAEYMCCPDAESEETAQPTATEPGLMTYTATVTVDGVTYTDVYTEEIPALGQPAVEAAQALIDAIGEVTYTEDCKAAIDMARALYDSLTEEEKALVTNLAVLEAAEQAYAALTPGDSDTPDNPDTPANPDDPQEDGLCKWCGERHESFWGRILGFFHSLLYFFAHLFGRK